MYRVAALLLAAATACSAGVESRLTPADPPAPQAPAATPSAAPAPPAKPAEPADDGTRARGDVDGDGRADLVRLVESSRRRNAAWRFGVRVRLATGQPLTYWFPRGAGAMDGQRLGRVVDVTGDGTGDVVVSGGTTAYGMAWDVLTLTGGRLVPLRGADLWHGLFQSWGCERDGVYAGEAEHHADDTITGRVTSYRVEGTSLVPVSTRRVPSWRLGDEPPREFDPAPGCGAFG